MPTDHDVARVSAALSRTVIMLAGARGVPTEPLLATVGLSLEQLAEPDATVPLPVHLDLWRQASAMSGDNQFGLHMAESIPKGIFGLREYVICNSPNLEGALQAMIRYQRLCSAGTRRLVYEPSTVRIEVDTYRSVGAPPRHVAEFVIAGMLEWIRSSLGEGEPRAEVWFHHAAPPDVREHERIFKCPIHFERQMTALVLDRALLGRPILGADATLRDLLAKQAAAILERIGDRVDLVTRVHREICTELNGKPPTLARVAKQLGMSTRSLQRQLKANGTSFKKLLDETCNEIARYQIGQQRLPVSEVAFLLGYSEVSAFHRAFRRWTGMSPTQYRRMRSVPDASVLA